MIDTLFSWLDRPDTISTIITAGSMTLFGIGLFGLLSYRKILKILISISFMETALFIYFIGMSQVTGYTAPILSKGMGGFVGMNDPVPQALILTAIVIGLAVMALGVSLAIEYHDRCGVSDIDAMNEAKDDR
jgi:multisubunit Na+/H+ antiporter MnhC subunit